MESWRERAAQWGIEPSYFDVQGQRHEADADTAARIVQVLAGSGHRPAAADGQALSPQPAYQGDGRRCWVLAVQLYGVRSQRNWGHGDFSDLATLLTMVADLGGAGVGLNPLHAQFYDHAGSGSPYSPNSRLFLNPLYIDVEAVEEFDPSVAASLTPDIDRLRSATLIDYSAVARVKLAALRAAHRAFVANASASPTPGFRRLSGGARQCAGAVFRIRDAAWAISRPVVGLAGTMADTDRRDVAAPADSAIRTRSASTNFCNGMPSGNSQNCRDIARQRGLSIGLYLDTAIGVDATGADAWMDQDTVLRGLSVGAPPDHSILPARTGA